MVWLGMVYHGLCTVWYGMVHFGPILNCMAQWPMAWAVKFSNIPGSLTVGPAGDGNMAFRATISIMAGIFCSQGWGSAGRSRQIETKTLDIDFGFNMLVQLNPPIHL